MAAIIRVPGLTTNPDLPKLSDLPFPKQSLLAWIEASGAVRGLDEIVNPINDANTGEAYSAMTVGSGPILQYVDGRIPVLRSRKSASATTGFYPYSIPLDLFAGRGAITIAGLWKPGTPIANFSELVRGGESTALTAPTLALGVHSSGYIRLTTRRGGSTDTDVTTLQTATLNTSEWLSILAKIDYTNNLVTMEINGQKYESPIAGASGVSPVGGNLLQFAGQASGATGICGDVADFMWFDGTIDAKTERMVKSYFNEKAIVLSAL